MRSDLTSREILNYLSRLCLFPAPSAANEQRRHTRFNDPAVTARPPACYFPTSQARSWRLFPQNQRARCLLAGGCSAQAPPLPRPTWPTRAARRRDPTGSASLTRTGRSRRQRGRHTQPRAQAHARRPGGRACWSRASTTGGSSRAIFGGACAAHVHGVHGVCHAEAHAGAAHEHHAQRPMHIQVPRQSQLPRALRRAEREPFHRESWPTRARAPCADTPPTPRG
jgi:hypothetical protein